MTPGGDERWSSWEEHLDWLQERYEDDGWTLERLGEEVGISAAAVARRLDERGVERRPARRRTSV